MKRHGLALLVHPYKNVLMKRDALRSLLNRFTEKILAIASAHPNLRINISLPGYMLQHVDALLLSQLNEVQKSNCLEWLTPGYTEPFVNFSPLSLSRDNVQQGSETFFELVGIKPSGYVPAFSNWEPCAIPFLLESGIHYAVLARTLLPEPVQDYCGYWITEHAGHAITVIPTSIVTQATAPRNIITWLDKTIKAAPATDSPIKLCALDYRIPLESPKDSDPYAWIATFAQALDTILIRYELNLLHELPSRMPPLGLHAIPSCLEFRDENNQTISSCLNYLHTFDSVGIMQRKMMALAEAIAAVNHKEILPQKKQLFFIQDINRYLPDTASGFPHIKDRFWTFRQMVAVEREIMKKNNITGGQVRIADLLKNGTKSIVMSNRSLIVCIDHKNGGQVFELDYLERAANLFAGYNPTRHMPPQILVAGKSRTSFIDHFVNEKCSRTEFIDNTVKHYGDFVTGQFDYKVKKTSASVKTILSHQGFITIENKQYPLVIEKVFGLEKDKPELSFVYQLSNHSLTTYTFKLAIELTFGLPGVQSHQAEITCDTVTHNRLAWDRITFNNVTKWVLADKKVGFAVHCITQKPVTLWSYPVVQSSPYQGTTIVMSTPVSLEENAAWSLIGKLSCKKIPCKGDIVDVV